MQTTDTPFPATLTALQKLSARQMEFCRMIIAGSTGVAAYRAAYGADSSGCHRRAAAKIKASAAVRKYLEAFRVERHQRMMNEGGRGATADAPGIPASSKCHEMSVSASPERRPAPAG